MYWQLAVPADEHLVFSPGAVTSEMVWGWQGMYWGRRPKLDQGDLEDWVGSLRQKPLPEQTNRYLYSTFGAPDQIRLLTAGRGIILLVVSGAALVAGLLLIYVPAVRKPAVLLIASIALLAWGVWCSGPALLAGQVAGLGLVLVLLARLLEWAVVGRRQGRPVIHGTSNAAIERASSTMKFQGAEGSSQTITSTATAGRHVPGPDEELSP